MASFLPFDSHTLSVLSLPPSLLLIPIPFPPSPTRRALSSLTPLSSLRVLVQHLLHALPTLVAILAPPFISLFLPCPTPQLSFSSSFLVPAHFFPFISHPAPRLSAPPNPMPHWLLLLFHLPPPPSPHPLPSNSL
ncbi:Hypothetical predicted protein [Octopus vulgaris]|uniref:Uncharacterized protein n=1 Tax=Octopus vulgaris TaxID=6645 RepID=A0AA36FNC6_OCTVU|nr:Hypothetical predicted protein [Octopus vulgaris]